MLELFIEKKEKSKRIALVEDSKLVEFYEENENENRNEGNIYIGIVKNILNGMESAFVDIGTGKNSLIHLTDLLPKLDIKKEQKHKNVAIDKTIKPGDKILVQVKKDSNEIKGARTSTHINLPSRYIVLMPNTDIITISQKIENKEEQERLINLVKENLSEENGAIIRTSAEGKSQEIIDDIKRIEEKWNLIKKESKEYNKNNPQLIYKAEDITNKILLDFEEKTINSIYTNNEEECKKIREYGNYNIIFKNKGIFEKYDIEKQINNIKNRKIWLNCGGFITIDKTEALTAIDVNTGKFTGKDNLMQTILKVNKEATIEIARQLRLRDIGGIIIIDYIDMKSEESKKEIQDLLITNLKKDRSKTQVEGFTKLDLMEMTRKHICSHKN
ncbi:MAG: Rne/Rng family ribonuclease [Clostridia bacterium]|nr:Rne/Rng family ribonuclease [Clostridia bacterium]